MDDIVSRLSDKKTLEQKFEAGGTSDPDFKEIALEKLQMNPFVLQSEISQALNEREKQTPRRLSRDVPF